MCKSCRMEKFLKKPEDSPREMHPKTVADPVRIRAGLWVGLWVGIWSGFVWVWSG